MTTTSVPAVVSGQTPLNTGETLVTFHRDYTVEHALVPFLALSFIVKNENTERFPIGHKFVVTLDSGEESHDADS